MDSVNKEPKILDKGPLVDAIMASCSMPGLFAPFKLKEETRKHLDEIRQLVNE